MLKIGRDSLVLSKLNYCNNLNRKYGNINNNIDEKIKDITNTNIQPIFRIPIHFISRKYLFINYHRKIDIYYDIDCTRINTHANIFTGSIVGVISLNFTEFNSIDVDVVQTIMFFLLQCLDCTTYKSKIIPVKSIFFAKASLVGHDSAFVMKFGKYGHIFYDFIGKCCAFVFALDILSFSVSLRL